MCGVTVVVSQLWYLRVFSRVSFVTFPDSPTVSRSRMTPLLKHGKSWKTVVSQLWCHSGVVFGILSVNECSPARKTSLSAGQAINFMIFRENTENHEIHLVDVKMSKSVEKWSSKKWQNVEKWSSKSDISAKMCQVSGRLFTGNSLFYHPQTTMGGSWNGTKCHIG